MARIPEEVIRAVQEATDIVEVVGRYVTLKRSGSTFKGLCPFHEEKTPSFSVFPSSGRYKCFGCSEGGDAFTFLMKRNGIVFRDAVEELARDAGILIPVPSESESEEERERSGRRRRALEALDFARGFYRALLQRPAAREALEYLRRRGFTDATIEAHDLGFSSSGSPTLRDYALEKGFTDEALVDAGLARRNDQGMPRDFFFGRVMFPIRDLRGGVVGFGARAMGDSQPKYLNSADSSLFHKGRELYALHLARPAAMRRGRLVIVEGYTDVLHCHQAGFEEVAAGLGTALTAENARQLRRFGVPVCLVYDGDEAGRRAAERACGVFLEEEVQGSVALLPPGLDPADLLKERGPAAFEEILGGSRDLWDYLVDRVLERQDLATLDGRERAADALLGYVTRLKSALRRDSAFKLLSWRLQMPESILRDRLPAPSRPRTPSEPQQVAAPVSVAWRRAEEDLLLACLLDGEFFAELEEAYPPEEFRDPDLRDLLESFRDLRGGGQSPGREALLGAVAERDSAVRALLAMDVDREPAETMVRARGHLRYRGERRRIELARRETKDALEAIVRARGGRIATDEVTERNDDRELRP